MIIGTAGHIDHGKTSLVKALTGIDADRLPEEKVRGITIELGFAYTTSDQNKTLGYVDVPGHEKFIHTMVSGAVGIDYGLLIIAADDGVMPQTREHLRILTLLNIPNISVVITKIDLVDSQQIDLVKESIQGLLNDSIYENAKNYLVSNISGVGIDELKHDLFELANAKTPDNSNYFRLAIDRVFVVKGIGVAVTGAVMSGELSVGDILMISPLNKLVRVRSIHAQNKVSENAVLGQRCGIVVSGIEYQDIARGQWLVHPNLAVTTQRVDCWIQVPKDAEKPIKDGDLLLLHHGTDHLITRIILLDQSVLLTGQSGLAQCTFQRPLSIFWQDRFILRDSNAKYSLGGGIVLDINPPIRGRKKIDRIKTLQSYLRSSAEEVIDSLLLDSQNPLPIHSISTSMNCSWEQLENNLKHKIGRKLVIDKEEWILGDGVSNNLIESIQKILSDFHQKNPEEVGLSVDALRKLALIEWHPELFKVFIQVIIKTKEIILTGNLIHLPTHKVELSPREQAIWDKSFLKLTEAQFNPPWVRDIASQLGVAEEIIRATLRKGLKTNQLLQVVPDLFYPFETMQVIAQSMEDLLKEFGVIRIKDFRDRLGIGRNRSVQILEAFDKMGFTHRIVVGKEDKDHRIIKNRSMWRR
jgi:selenocysteine-specific elongation factor